MILSCQNDNYKTEIRLYLPQFSFHLPTFQQYKVVFIRVQKIVVDKDEFSFCNDCNVKNSEVEEQRGGQHE